MEELQKDLQEIEKLLALAERTRVKNLLSSEVRKIQSEIKTKQSEEVPKPVKPVSDMKPSYTKDITNYAWDQTNGVMKIYITDLKDVQKLSAENVTSEFKDRSVKVKISNLNGVNYVLHVAHLFDKIIPAKSYHKVKTDMVLVMLKKAEEKTWAYVTETEKKIKDKKPQVDEHKDPNESLMDLMKQMYQDGDDEMKRTIAKAWTESQDKRSKDSDSGL